MAGSAPRSVERTSAVGPMAPVDQERARAHFPPSTPKPPRRRRRAPSAFLFASTARPDRYDGACATSGGECDILGRVPKAA